MHSRLGCVLTLLLVAGCSQQKIDPLAQGGWRDVWPKGPDAPRVRYLGALTGADDFGAVRAKSFLGELIHGPTPPAKFVTPMGVAVNRSGSKVAVADSNDGSVHVFDLTAKSYKRIDRWAGDNMFASPVAVAWVGDALWVADSKLGAVVVIPTNGQGRLIGQGQLKRPSGMAYSAANGLCYVVDSAGHKVIAFDRSGSVALTFGHHGAGPGQFNFPTHIAIGPDDTLVVSDSLNFSVQRLSLKGAPLSAFGRKGDAAGDLALPKGIAVDPDGNIWVADAHFENVQAFNASGELLLSFGEEGKGVGEFWLPAGMFIDMQRRLWVADSYNRRVQVFQLL
ncbi:MAG: hypothetical protein GXP29_14450 [Planctomycetes bacterium]|nr:hypothetical protein [Planctomycetota bacterium]